MRFFDDQRDNDYDDQHGKEISAIVKGSVPVPIKESFEDPSDESEDHAEQPSNYSKDRSECASDRSEHNAKYASDNADDNRKEQKANQENDNGACCLRHKSMV